jgi:hypothetical protein
MDWSMDQAMEHLLCKTKALSSNPSPTKKKKKSTISVFVCCGEYMSVCATFWGKEVSLDRWMETYI